jgi:hypothetical protein
MVSLIVLSIAVGATPAAYRMLTFRRTTFPTRAESMRVLAAVVQRAREAPTPQGDTTEVDGDGDGNVTILGGQSVRPMAFDAAVPPRRPRRSRSMSPAAIAARRARAEVKSHSEEPTLGVKRCPSPTATRVVIVSDDSLAEPPEPPSSPGPARAPRAARAQRASRAPRANKGRRSKTSRPDVGGLATALLLVVLVGGLVYASVHTRSGANSHATSPVAIAAGGVAPSTAPPSPAPAAPPSTVAVMADGQHATVATGATYQLTVASTGPCWVRVTNPATGQVILETTLQPNQPQALPLTGPTHLRVGAANTMSLTLDGLAVPLSGLPAGPYDVDFTGV